MTVRTALCLTLTALIPLAGIPTASAEDPKKENPHARWEPAIQRFEEADQDHPRPRHGMLFVGSSSIRFWNLKKSFPELPAINHGFGGSQIADTVYFADRIVWPFQPEVIVMYAGDNDIAAGKSPQTVSDDFRTFSDMVARQQPDTHLVFIAIKPSIARWSLAEKMSQANSAIAEQCAASDLRTFVDVWPAMLNDDGQPDSGLFIKDGLHLNEAGYELWTKLVSEALPKPAEAAATE